MPLTPDDHEAFATEARRLAATLCYLTLSTADAAGRPWVTPVYFTPDGDDRVLWVSSPAARHSRNIAERADVAIVVFDSTVPIGGAQALYASARAGLVADDQIDASAATFNARLVALGADPVDDDLRGGPLRLYEAVLTERSVLLRGGDARNPTGIDLRVDVPLAPAPGQ